MKIWLRTIGYVPMEPRPFRHGNIILPHIWKAILSSFNGATSLQTWWLSCRRVLAQAMGLFQWCHDLSTIVTICWKFVEKIPSVGFNGATSFQTWWPVNGPNSISANRRVSMEPRLFSHGNSTVDDCDEVDGWLFQWSHDSLVMVTA